MAKKNMKQEVLETTEQTTQNDGTPDLSNFQPGQVVNLTSDDGSLSTILVSVKPQYQVSDETEERRFAGLNGLTVVDGIPRKYGIEPSLEYMYIDVLDKSFKIEPV